MTEYSTLLNSLITNGITEDSLNKLTTVSQNAYSKTIEAISKLSALEVPAKYTALNSATTKYLNSVASLSQLVLNLSNGSISSDEFESKFNSIGSQLMLDQAEYQRVFAEIIK
jgi:hypothetical protein